MVEKDKVVINAIVRGCDAGYMGFIDRREELGGDTIYVLDGDPWWLLKQRDSLEVLLRDEKGKTKISLGDLRDNMRKFNVVVLTEYEQYKAGLKEKGVTPYISPRTLAALRKVCLKE